MAEPVRVLNVLSKEHYDDCHIKGSINVPLNQLPEYATGLKKDQKIVVYCAHYDCKASHKAWHILHDMGFKHVWAYEGGMAEWHQKGYPTEGSCQKEHLSRQYQPPEAEGRVRKISANDLLKLMDEAGCGCS